MMMMVVVVVSSSLQKLCIQKTIWEYPKNAFTGTAEDDHATKACEYKEMQTSDWMDAMLIHSLDLASSDLRGCQGNNLSKCSIHGLDLHSRWWITWNKYQREVMYRQVHQYSGYERSRTGLVYKVVSKVTLDMNHVYEAAIHMFSQVLCIQLLRNYVQSVRRNVCRGR